ncbi:GlsB/YeaQ/YmgE family stress response membrane protein [Luteimonas sp. e5]
MPLFGSENWLYIGFIGLLVGLLARLIKPGRERMGCLMTIVIGIGGALLAGAVGQHFGWYQPGQSAGFIAAVLGAIVILIVVGLFRSPRERRIFKSRR